MPLRSRLGLCLLTLALACGDDDAPTPPAATTPAVDLRVVAITDLQGYLEPCGCTSRPLGGIDRLAAKLQALADEAPTVFVSAGDLWLAPQGHGEAAATQERWRAETLVAILNDLGLAAAAPGPADLREGRERFMALREALGSPVLAAGAHVGETVLPASTRIEAGGLAMDVFGASRLDVDPVPALREALAARSDVPPLTVALVVGDRRAARNVAALPGVDAVIVGGLARAEPLAPQATDGAPIFHAGRQGQGLLVLDLFRPSAEGAWVDVSEWSLQTRREALEAEITDLESRVAIWEREGRTGDDVATQRGRLEGLRAELASLRTPSLPEGRRGFAARWVELDPDAPRAPTVRDRLAALDVRINDHNRTALADHAPPALEEGQAGYVGSQACSSCHAAAFTWWRSHPHGRAYETLATRHKEFHLDCVGCHVTGYERPGGSTVTHLGDGGVLRDVGCENCHGPGSAHVAAPSSTNVQRDTPASVCVRCHNEEHSDRFVYEAYRTTLLVPGHGRPEGSP
ncbi:MAG: hypothetical protein H6721_12750 [Sandaracinus sp.]|nr:hypothetical protein [Sandaracinus sp.]